MPTKPFLPGPDEEKQKISLKKFANIMRPFLTGEKNILDCEVPPPKAKSKKAKTSSLVETED